MASLLSLHRILDINKLMGSNFVDYLKNLKIVLTQEKVSYILDTPDPGMIGEDAIEKERAIYKI